VQRSTVLQRVPARWLRPTVLAHGRQCRGTR
jgi:hypothetical protein